MQTLVTEEPKEKSSVHKKSHSVPALAKSPNKLTGITTKTVNGYRPKQQHKKRHTNGLTGHRTESLVHKSISGMTDHPFKSK